MSLQIWCSPVQTPVKNTPQSQSPPRSLCPGTLLHHAQFTWHNENFVSEHWPARSFTARQQGELLTLSEADLNQSLAVSTEDLASDVITNRIPGVKKKKGKRKDLWMRAATVELCQYWSRQNKQTLTESLSVSQASRGSRYANGGATVGGPDGAGALIVWSSSRWDHSVKAQRSSNISW